MSVKLPDNLPAAESYATKRIKTLQEKVKEAETDTEQTLKTIHDRFERQAEQQNQTQEARREQLEQKGYEELKRTKDLVSRQQHQKDMEGKRALANTQEYYDENINYTKKRGDGYIRNLENRNEKEIQMINEDAERRIMLTRMDQEKRIDQIKSMTDEQFADYMAERKRMEADIRLKNEQAVRDADKHYGDNTKKIMDDHQKNLSNLNNKASQQLENLQDKYSQKLAAYSDRAHDPFYKMADVPARVREDQDNYYLIAKIPAHEQDHVTLTIKGQNTLVLNGRRTMQDRKQTDEGGFISTSSFQSFTQAFPLDMPVEEKAVMKEVSGDEVVFTVAKMGRPASPTYQVNHNVDKAKGMAPNFPTNLPIQSPKKGHTLG